MDFTFAKIQESLLKLDPVFWSEKYLRLDGKPYRVADSGYKPIADIMRYVGIKALEKDAKPIVWLKSRQISGTVTATAIELFFMASGLFGNDQNPPMRVAHVFPTLDHAEGFSKTKLSAMIDDSVIIDEENVKKKDKKPYLRSMIDKTSASNDSSKFKQFVGGNHLWIESAGISGERLRGKTCDVLIMDEVQDIPAAAIANSQKILNKAQYGRTTEGIQMYFGTPKQKGSDFWNIWQKSSQQYYYLGCAKCKKHFPLYTPGSDDWEKVWLYENVVKCTFCDHEQDRLECINRGKWIGTRDIEDCTFIGFHLNQLYMPDVTKEILMSKKPGVSAINTERAYQNEVLGEFFQGEASIITIDEIRDKCGDPERKFRNGFSEEEEEKVITFLGVDIGAKGDLEQLANADKLRGQGQSYSTAVVLALNGAGNLSIEYAFKFKRNDIASKKAILDETIKRYRCVLSVCDIGFAHDFNEIMQTEYGEKFLASQASGNVKEKVKFNNDIFPKVIAFERDHWIREMYEQMKKGMIRFPLGSYEQIMWLMQHCTNMEIKPSISRTGDVTPHYVKSGVNDGFMALLNAYLAYKFHMSKGFTRRGGPAGGEFPRKEQSSVISVYAPRSFSL